MLIFVYACKLWFFKLSELSSSFVSFSFTRPGYDSNACGLFMLICCGMFIAICCGTFMPICCGILIGRQETATE